MSINNKCEKLQKEGGKSLFLFIIYYLYLLQLHLDPTKCTTFTI